MNPNKNLIEPKPYMNPTKNLIELKYVKYYRFDFGNNPEQNKSKQNTFFIVAIFSIVLHFDDINIWKLISYKIYLVDLNAFQKLLIDNSDFFD